MFGFFKKYDAHLCSAVSGRIVNNGVPVEGLKVERQLLYTDEKNRIDTAYTDKNGNFTLPKIDIRSRAPGWTLVDQRTQQRIWVLYNNKYYILWSTALKSIEPSSSFDKKLSELNADLTTDLVAFTFINTDSPNTPHCAKSICRWENDFEILHIIED